MIGLTEVSGLKITTLLDNLTESAGPVGHWGYSALLEYEAEGRRRRVLLDTGSDPYCFLRNIKELKINLTGIDSIVLSHGHYDHTSSTVEAVKAAGGVRVFSHPSAFSPAYVINEKGERRRISIPDGQGVQAIESAGGEVALSRTPIEAAPGVWVTGEVPRKSFETVMELGKSRLVKVEDGSEALDTIPDDQALFLYEKGFGLVVLTGCAHSGSINILSHVEAITGERVKALIGGIHLMSRKPEYTKATVDRLGGFGLQILSPCHCTGFMAMAELARAFPDSFELNYSGRIIGPAEILRERLGQTRATR
jgi:7,8-dihydropterin-6-yl-methyl-4-(beta-D-ribofuranosyl)aminobenzene 5'-phosphate synthase